MDPHELVSAFQQALFSGQGLLDARALWASIVGPSRLAMGAFSSVTLTPDKGAVIHKNLGASDAYVYVGVSLPAGENVPATAAVMFSNSNQVGPASSAVATLIPSMIGGNFFPAGFAQLLKPGDELYARLNDPALITQAVVVSKVFF